MDTKSAVFIREQEGRRYHSYLDTAGVWTIGDGSTMYQTGIPVGEGETINDAQADALRDWEITQKTKVITHLLNGLVLTDNQMVPLVSFTYQEGVGGLQSSTLLKVIKKDPNSTTVILIADVPDKSVKDWMQKNNWLSVNEITMWFMVWNKVKNPKTGVKEFSEAILNRRIREAKMYFS